MHRNTSATPRPCKRLFFGSPKPQDVTCRTQALPLLVADGHIGQGAGQIYEMHLAENQVLQPNNFMCCRFLQFLTVDVQPPSQWQADTQVISSHSHSCRAKKDFEPFEPIQQPSMQINEDGALELMQTMKELKHRRASFDLVLPCLIKRMMKA